MSLCDMTIAQKEQPPFSSCQSAISAARRERITIRLKTIMFLRNGGKISTGSQPLVDVPIKKQMDEKRKKAISSTRSNGAAILGVPHKIQVSATGHQNIHPASNNRFKVVVKGKSFGIFEKESDAIAARDKAREEYGMPRADY